LQGVAEYRGAILVDMLVEHDSAGGARQQTRQLGVALAQRWRPDLLAVVLRPVSLSVRQPGPVCRLRLRRRQQLHQPCISLIAYAAPAIRVFMTDRGRQR